MQLYSVPLPKVPSDAWIWIVSVSLLLHFDVFKKMGLHYSELNPEHYMPCRSKLLVTLPYW